MASVACLTKETSSTLYLDPGGTVTWSVLDRNVRSGGAEELEYLNAIVRDDHGVTRAFRKLGALEVSTQVLRSIRPYSVLAEGRFSGIDILGQRLLDACGLRGLSTLRQHPDGSTTWILVVHADEQASADDSVGIGDDQTKIVLTRGRFLSAEGFVIAGDEATFPSDSPEPEEGTPITLSLTWTAREE